MDRVVEGRREGGGEGRREGGRGEGRREGGREGERGLDSFSYSCSCSDCTAFHKLKPQVVGGWEGGKREEG